MSRIDSNATPSPKPQQQIDRWPKTRAAGRWPFILKHGVLGWGVGVVAGITLMDWYRGELGDDFLVLLAIRLPLFMLGGLAWGALMWAILERYYRRNGQPAE